MGIVTETVSLPMVCEMDLMDDAIRALSYAMGSLASKHGEHYRDYERRLVDLLDGALGECTVSQIEPGRLVIVPPIEWRAMVTEGRELGVI